MICLRNWHSFCFQQDENSSKHGFSGVRASFHRATPKKKRKELAPGKQRLSGKPQFEIKSFFISVLRS